MMEPLTENELGRIASQHVSDRQGDCAGCPKVQDAGGYEIGVSWPCDAAKLYQLVIRQSALLASFGLPCACDPDFDLPDVPASKGPS